MEVKNYNWLDALLQSLHHSSLGEDIVVSGWVSVLRHLKAYNELRMDQILHSMDNVGDELISHHHDVRLKPWRLFVLVVAVMVKATYS